MRMADMENDTVINRTGFSIKCVTQKRVSCGKNLQQNSVNCITDLPIFSNKLRLYPKGCIEKGTKLQKPEHIRKKKNTCVQRKHFTPAMKIYTSSTRQAHDIFLVWRRVCDQR